MVHSVLIFAKDNARFKIPNLEVKMDWARWVTRGVERPGDILKTCVEGPTGDFEANWPGFMQRTLHPRLVAKERDSQTGKTLENIYRVYFYGLLISLGAIGWKFTVEERGCLGYVDLRLVHKQKGQAVLIELKWSKEKKDMEKDANSALKQIVNRNYRNSTGLAGIITLREYGIARCHLDSLVKGRYLILNKESRPPVWEERDDPASPAMKRW
jgi:hypothetical protein